jgi:hypothetical protein
MGTDFNIEPAGAPVANDAAAYQVVDNRTSMVLQPLAYEAVLRRRAYFRALGLAGRAPRRVVVTDRMA